MFFKNHGFKVRLTIKEDENWSELNEGKMAASVTTVDVLAAYGKQLHAVVPAQIGFSRGADGIVVRSDIKRINQLKGKTIATAQFTEVDFFIRYLAQEAGLPINTLGSLDATPHPERLNLVYTEDGFGAGDLFLNDIKSGKNRLAGLRHVGTEGIGGRGRQRRPGARAGDEPQPAHHRRRADRAPRLRAGAAEDRRGAGAGPARRQSHGPRSSGSVPRRRRPVVQVEPRRDARASSRNVHLSNLPENLAFFSGAIDAAGSFESIYQSAVLAYGSDLIKDPPDASRFASLGGAADVEKSGVFKEQKVAIAPIRSGGGASLEANPLLSKDIRFLFEANSSTLDHGNQENLKNLEAIKRLVQVSPGSTLLLRGHVDNARVDEFRKQGGEALRPHAWRCARWRSARIARGEIRKLLVERYGIDAKRIEIVGRGWEEPSGPNSDLNRRVEVQWFTIDSWLRAVSD